MGIGDEIMAAAEARRAYAGEPTLIVDKNGAPRWHSVWRGVPHVLPPGRATAGSPRLLNAAGARPYIDYAAMKRRDGPRYDPRNLDQSWIWKQGWRPAKGHIHLSDEERERARVRLEPHRHAGRSIYILEPSLKPKASPNKQWGHDRWQALVQHLYGAVLLQVGAECAVKLQGTQFIGTPDFHAAAALLEASDGYIGPDGALHHAAAALGVPAVVIWGGYSSPDNLGYDGHKNLTGGVTAACGSRRHCNHCAAAMTAITPDQVAAAIL